MAAVVHNNNHHNVDPKPSTKSSSSNQFANWVIPEVIEERRKRTDGRIVCNRYATGKLLGKVRQESRSTISSHFSSSDIHHHHVLLLFQGGFAKVFVGTLLPSKHEYALKIVSKASLAKERARLKVVYLNDHSIFLLFSSISSLSYSCKVRLRSTSHWIMKILSDLNVVLKIILITIFLWNFARIK